MPETVVSDTFVYEWIQWSRLWREGDKFSLRDVDGGTPTGEYTIAAIRVKVIRYAEGIACINRVSILCREIGSWCSIGAIVPFKPKDTREAYVERIVDLVREAIEEHGEGIIRVPCEHGGDDHPVYNASKHGKDAVYLSVDNQTDLESGDE